MYNKDYSIDIPPGDHLVSIRDIAGDWVALSHITLKSYSQKPLVVVAGVKGEGFAAFWIHDKADNWKARLDGRHIPEATGLRVTVGDMADGSYTAEWWDTTKGKVIRAEAAEVRNGSAALDIPLFTGDIACKLIRK